MKKILTLLLLVIVTSSYAQEWTAEFQVDNCDLDSTVNINVVVENGEAPYTYQWNIAGLTGDHIYNVPYGYYCVIVYDVSGDSLLLCIDIDISNAEFLCDDNLITDPSFEDWDPDANTTIDNIEELNQWWEVNGTPDYHHQQHSLGNYLNSLEDCPLGNGDIHCGVPIEGEAVLGVWKGNGETGSKEWAATQLSEPMQAGSLYKVSFWIQNKKDDPNWTMETSNWGMYFNNDEYPQFDPNDLDFSSVPNHYVMMESILDSNDWRYTEWIYQPDFDYEYMYLGFMGDSISAIQNIWNSSPNIGFYAWIDQVQVKPLSNDAFLIPSDEYVVCIGDSVQLNVVNSIPISWLTGNDEFISNSSSIWVSPSENTTYYINYGGTSYYPLIDSINVIVADCLCENEGDFSTVVVENSLCPYEDIGDGSIEINSSDDLNDFTYYWNDLENQNTSTATNLTGGNYTCFILDSLNCVDTLFAFVDGIPLLEYNFNIGHLSCDTCTDGSLSLDISNGNSPYTYLWSTGETTELIEDLSSDWYSLSVTDASGCVYIDSTYLFYQDSCANLGVFIDDYIDLSCNDPAYVSCYGFGDFPPFSYSWDTDPPVNNNVVNIDSSGIYNITIVDDIGCSSNTFILINDNFVFDYELDANLVTSPFRPDFTNSITIDAFNNGCVLTEGSVTLILDDLLDLESTSDPHPDSISGDTLIWNFDEINSNSDHLIFNIETTPSLEAVIGDTVCMELYISPLSGDADSTNNYKHYCFPVVNGYDPNDKQVYPQGICEGHFVLKTDPLTYTIRFQNTGNAEAINVHIMDSLSSYLDINTVEILGSSHDMYTLIRPDNVLDFMFDDIWLPDSTSNEPESHGYVIYKVHPNSFIYNGTYVDNKAEIYFDFNPPIVTNTVFNTLVNVLLSCDINMGVDEDLNSVNDLKIYPNPSNGIFNVETNDLTNASIRIYNISGQQVYFAKGLSGSKHIIQLNEPKGMYILELISNGERQYYKLMNE